MSSAEEAYSLKDRGVTVAIVSTAGNAGRQIAVSLIAKQQVLAALGSLTIQFVGSRNDDSLPNMIGLCGELRDGFDICPDLEIVLDTEAVQADIIVNASGHILSPRHKTFKDLARANMDIFGQQAQQLVARNRDSLILIVSNPVEFAVDTFVDAGFKREQVIGFGAHLDTMRFRREIASELGVPKQRVLGLCLGQHGLATVPCWSTVQLTTSCMDDGTDERLEKLKEEGLARLPRDVAAIRRLASDIRRLAEKGDGLAAIGVVNSQPPDLRACLRRYVSFFSSGTYPRVGAGEKVSRLIADILTGRETLTALQVRISDSDRFLGINGHAVGAPVILSSGGAKVQPVDLTPVEREAVMESAKESEVMSEVMKELAGLRSKYNF